MALVNGCSSTVFNAYGIRYNQIIYAGELLGISIALLIHLEHITIKVFSTGTVVALMVTMSMESVSHMEEIHESTSGHLQEVWRRQAWSWDLHSTVLALT